MCSSHSPCARAPPLLLSAAAAPLTALAATALAGAPSAMRRWNPAEIRTQRRLRRLLSSSKRRGAEESIFKDSSSFCDELIVAKLGGRSTSHGTPAAARRRSLRSGMPQKIIFHGFLILPYTVLIVLMKISHGKKIQLPNRLCD